MYNRIRHHTFSTATACIFSIVAGSAYGIEYPGEISEWQGFTQNTFEVDGCKCTVVAPAQPAAEAPWLLYANPPDAASVLDKRLLDKGFYIIYMDVEDLYGNDAAINHWTVFYDWARKTLSLAEKPVIAGKEHGTLLLYNWAAQNCDKVACIYAEHPWLELRATAEGETIDDVTAKAVAANEGNKNKKSLAEQAGIVGKAAIPVMHLYSEQKPGQVPNKNIQQFYTAYRLAGKGPFESLTMPSASNDIMIDLTIAPLIFLLKHTKQLSGAPLEEPIAGMPQWKVADFVGRANVFVLDDVLVMEEGNEMTGIVCAEEPLTMNYEISLDAMRLAGGDFFCGLTAPYGEVSFSLVVGGWGGTCVGISSLDWLDAYHNETARFRSFTNHRWYRIRLRVTEGNLQAWIDGAETVNVDVGGRDLDIRWEMSPTVPLGVATWCTTGAIKNFSVRPIEK